MIQILLCGPLNGGVADKRAIISSGGFILDGASILTAATYTLIARQFSKGWAMCFAMENGKPQSWYSNPDGEYYYYDTIAILPYEAE